MNRNLKYFFGGLATVFAGLGLYKIISSQKNANRMPEDVWTIWNMPDLTGNVIIVTGANSGIGYEAAKAFARKGANVILACRNLEKAAAALAELQAEIPNAQAEIMQLDLASQASVHQFANAFKAKYDRLDVLVNNAGIMMVPYATTEDGFESQFATNHLGHFALTGLLIDLLLNTPGSRVVNVSSTGHRMGSMDFDNLMFEDGNGYSPSRAYGRSKLANLLFTYELQRRFEAIGADAMATAAHPGGTKTNLGRHLAENWYMKLAEPLVERMMQEADMGALPTIRAAVDPNAKGGDYYGPNGFMEQGGYPILVQSNEASHNLADAKQLWDVSEELTGVTYGSLG
jgi:NAD(P)-dependent dehydrogenase (short-subunit alcohol dehydrogenase family)